MGISIQKSEQFTSSGAQPGARIEAIVVAISILGIASHLVLRYLFHREGMVSDGPLILTMAAGGLPMLWTLVRRLVNLEFGSDLLAGLSIVTAAFMGQYLAGAVIVLMLSGGTVLERFAARRASALLNEIYKRAPRIAHRKTGDGFQDIGLDAVQVGDTLVILPHEISPADGTVMEGHGGMDESYLTGEPYQVSKAPGAAVLSGAINGEEPLVIVAAKVPADSRHAKIIQLFHEAETKRPRMQRLGDRLGAWYTPFALAIAVLAWLGSGDSLRFLAVIVIATPCPMLIAIPVAIIGAISLSSKRGIILKNPAALEQMDQCQVLVFDKTGTLTYGKPSLTDVLCMEGFEHADILGKAASLEQYSKHPLAAAILAGARREGIPLIPATLVSEKPGAGLQGLVDGITVKITGRGQADAAGLPDPVPGLECLIYFDQRLAAVVRFRDEPRAESRAFITHLKPRHGVKRAILLSGDREVEVRHLAHRVGITEAHFNKSPEEKVAFIRQETAKNKTLFVGDGINDAPAMLAATASVALGAGSNIAAEAADAVVLDSSLERVDELLHIAGRTRRIALESAVGGMVLSLIGMGFAAAGLLPPAMGAVAQELIDLAAVLNALRVSFVQVRLADVPSSS